MRCLKSVYINVLNELKICHLERKASGGATDLLVMMTVMSKEPHLMGAAQGPKRV